MNKGSKVVLKFTIVLVITTLTLGVPSLVIFFQRGAENNFIPTESRIIDNPLGTMAGGVSHSEQTLNISQDLGVSFGRMDISWSGVEKESGVFNFSEYDTRINRLTNNGIDVLGVLNYDNNAVETDPNGSEQDKYIAPSDVPKFINYVNQTLTQYYPNMTHFEIWNEPNLPLHWMGSWDDYAYLFNETVKFIKTNFPDVFLVGGSVSDMGHAFLEALFKDGSLQLCDAISFHTYHQYSESLIPRIWQLRDVCEQYGYTGEFWLTELGFPTGGTYIHVVDEVNQGDRLMKSVTLSIALGIDKIIWYTFSDGEHDLPLDSESYFGLLNNDLSYKTSAYAFKLFNQYCSNSTFRTDIISLEGNPSKQNLFSFLFQKENLTSTLVIWYKSSLVQDEKVKISLDFPAIPGTVRSHSFSDGSSQLLTDMSLKLGYETLFLTFTATAQGDNLIIFVSPSVLAIFAYMIIGIGLCAPVAIYMFRKFKILAIDKNKRNSDASG